MWKPAQHVEFECEWCWITLYTVPNLPVACPKCGTMACLVPEQRGEETVYRQEVVRMPLSESLGAQALRELHEPTCPNCGKAKLCSRSFCSPCYYRLPEAMRKALYHTFGRGYSNSYDEAKTYLKGEK